MKIYLDTANLNEIKSAIKLGVISGITTNPTLIAKEIKRMENLGQYITHGAVISDIISTVKNNDIVINVETLGSKTDDIVKEANDLSELSDKIVIKIPISQEGLKAINILRESQIATNSTLIFSPNQALLSANAGADYLSVFLGRIDDIGYNGIKVIKDIVDIFYYSTFNTNIIAASIRSPLHVTEVAKAGADICTIPYDILESMIKHPLTDIGIKKFNDDWEYTKNG